MEKTVFFTDEQYALFTAQLRTLLTVLEQSTTEQINALKETTEKERTKEKEKKENCCCSSSTMKKENKEKNNDGHEQQDNKLIFTISLFYLSQGYSDAYTEAFSVWQYNNSLNWRTRDGRLVENHEAWLKRALPKKERRFQPFHGRIFANIIEALALYSQDKFKPEELQQVINSFVGFREEGDAVYVGFCSYWAKNIVDRLCGENQSIVETFFTHMRSTFPNMVQLRIEKR